MHIEAFYTEKAVDVLGSCSNMQQDAGRSAGRIAGEIAGRFAGKSAG